MNDMLKAGVFDLDGVIVNTVPIHFKAWKRMFEEYGHSFTFQDYKLKVDGIPRIDGARAILTDLTDAELEEAANQKQNYFLDLLKQEEIPVFPSTIALIDEMREKGIKTIVTNFKGLPDEVKIPGMNC